MKGKLREKDKMLKNCPICRGKIKLVKKKKLISVPNPGELLIDTELGECSRCGEEYFDEDQAEDYAKKIDFEKEIIENKMPLKLESGTLII